MYIDADPNKRSYEMYMFFLGIGYCANIGGTGTIAAEETNIIIMVGLTFNTSYVNIFIHEKLDGGCLQKVVEP